MRALAQELVGLQNATPATAAVQRETRTIPIVFAKQQNDNVLQASYVRVSN
jgi:hypothetical protein